MHSTDDNQIKPIFDSLNDVRQQTGHGWSRVFRDWIEIVFCSLQRDDDGHGELVDGYETDFGEKTTQTVFEAYSEAFGDFPHISHPLVVSEVIIRDTVDPVVYFIPRQSAVFY